MVPIYQTNRRTILKERAPRECGTLSFKTVHRFVWYIGSISLRFISPSSLPGLHGSDGLPFCAKHSNRYTVATEYPGGHYWRKQQFPAASLQCHDLLLWSLCRTICPQERFARSPLPSWGLSYSVWWRLPPPTPLGDGVRQLAHGGLIIIKHLSGFCLCLHITIKMRDFPE